MPATAFVESAHPRAPKGSANGGKFTKKSGSGNTAATGSTQKTAEQIKAFQKANGLPVTGKFDARTKAALDSKKKASKSKAKKKSNGKTKNTKSKKNAKTSQTKRKARTTASAGTTTRKRSTSRRSALSGLQGKTKTAQKRRAALQKTAKKTKRVVTGHKTVQVQNRVVRIGQGGGTRGSATHSRRLTLYKRVPTKAALNARKKLTALKKSKKGK